MVSKQRKQGVRRGVLNIRLVNDDECLITLRLRDADNVRHCHQIASGIIGITDKQDLQALLVSRGLLVCGDIQSELIIQRHRLYRHPVSLRDKFVHRVGRTLNSNGILVRLAIGPDQQINRFISPRTASTLSGLTFA